MFEIRYFDNLPTIARVNRYTGAIDVNGKQINALPSMHQRFIIEHEKGHYNLQTSNELEADNYAFNQIAGSGNRSLKSSIEALTNVLSFKNPEHYKRVEAMTIQALLYDYKVNKNKKAFKALVEILNKKNKMKNQVYEHFDTSELLTSIGGIIGSGQNSNSGEKNSSKGGGDIDWNQVIGLGGQLLNQANTNNKPTTSTSKIDAVITPNINLGTNTNKSTLDTQINWEASLNNNNETTKKDNTMLYVGIGVAVFLVIGVATYFIVKKRG